MGLKSKSYGKGDERRVIVSKVCGSGSGLMSNMIMGSSGGGGNNQKKKKKGNTDNNENGLPTEDDYKHVPRINVGKRGEQALKAHLSKFPPTVKEEMESKETGSSMLLNEQVSGSRGDDLVDDNDSGNARNNGNNGTTALLTLDNLIQPPPIQADNNTKSSSSARQHQQQQKLQARHERMIQQRIQNHKQSQHETKTHSLYNKMMKQRMSLPAFGYANDICNILRNKKNQVVILTGDTGCGYVYMSCVFLRLFTYNLSRFKSQSNSLSYNLTLLCFLF